MSDKLKIKLSIANRVYPLTIPPSQEEGLRKAAQKIDAMIKQFEQSYSVRDKQDVLAMCALQFASQTEQKTIDNNNLNEEVEEKLVALDKLLGEYLNS
ncbi:cell division protein ZapA [Pontimicrobium sp. IMCC45349]|uniref:cell division protein ZapA n=1 Tax=Pontimicrobium sp. IMCC45349 TaxID=3391574 RepID=UPI0039A13FF2